MSLRPRNSLAIAALGLTLATLSGCGDGSSNPGGEPAKPIANANPTPDNPNVPIDEEYKHMDKLEKGVAPPK